MSRRARGRRPTLLRYALFQIPGQVLVAVALVAAVLWAGLSRRAALLLFGLWVLKDIALYPLVRIAYEPGPPHGGEALIGSHGVALGPLDAADPEGWVRIGAERWRARLARECTPVPAGAAVRVREVHGLTLTVEPALGSEREAAPVAPA